MQKSNIPPGTIEILLHYYCSTTDIDNIDTKFGKEGCEVLFKLGILKKSDKDGVQYEGVQAALDPYIDAICSIPLPEQKWMLPE